MQPAQMCLHVHTPPFVLDCYWHARCTSRIHLTKRCLFFALCFVQSRGYVAGSSATRTRRLCGGGNMCCVRKYAVQTAPDERSANSTMARVHGLQAAASPDSRKQSVCRSSRCIVSGVFGCRQCIYALRTVRRNMRPELAPRAFLIAIQGASWARTFAIRVPIIGHNSKLAHSLCGVAGVLLSCNSEAVELPTNQNNTRYISG